MEGEERWKVEGGGVEWGGREVEGRWKGGGIASQGNTTP